MKKPFFRSLLPYLILDTLALILLVVLLSLGQGKASLLVLLGTLLAQGIPASFLLSEHFLKKLTKLRTLAYVFGRFLFLLFAVLFPILLWYYGKGFQEAVNVGFLFYSPAFCYAEYLTAFLENLRENHASESTKRT